MVPVEDKMWSAAGFIVWVWDNCHTSGMLVSVGLFCLMIGLFFLIIGLFCGFGIIAILQVCECSWVSLPYNRSLLPYDRSLLTRTHASRMRVFVGLWASRLYANLNRPLLPYE